MKAEKLAERYLSCRIVSRLYASNVRRVARGVGVLSVDSINRYLRSRAEKVKPATVHFERAVVWGLLRFAYEERLIPSLPRGVVKTRASLPPVRAWSIGECCTAVKGCEKWIGVKVRSGADLGKMLRCWLLLGYESGARLGDLWSLRGSDFVDGALIWQQHKTNHPIVKVLSGPCLKAVAEMLKDSSDDTVLAWTMTKGSGGRRMKQYLSSIGLKGSSKWLRRSSATHIEALHPGKGRLHLGHKTPGLAEKHYIDWTQVRKDIPQPPCLVTGTD